VQHEVARILGFGAGRTVDPTGGFFKLGMDSMMTVELRRRLEAALDLSLPPTIAFEYPTVESLARHLAGEIAPKRQEPAAVVSEPDAAAIEKELDGLSDTDLAALLDSEIRGILTEGGQPS
jgi:acyl carrier protein